MLSLSVFLTLFLSQKAFPYLKLVENAAALILTGKKGKLTPVLSNYIMSQKQHITMKGSKNIYNSKYSILYAAPFQICFIFA